VYDNKGCPKPGLDSVLVTVTPKMNAFAGSDTAIITGQQLALHATGGVRYSWSPLEGMELHNSNRADPVIQFNTPTSGIRYRVLVFDEAGCVDSAFMNLKVFNTPPSIFVPNAFTPNGDGRNDKLEFIAAGMKRIDFFHVYNRYGQLVFSSKNNISFWDGNIGGEMQPSGSFIWMIRAVDFNGTPYFKKGTVLLIR
jgi:gliding motility-associated-like protein